MNHVSVSSRVRLARNVAELPFPGHINPAQQTKLWQSVCSHLSDCRPLSIDESNHLEATSLAEQHWISPKFANTGGTHGVLLDSKNGVSVMVNEEDHLRIQALKPGLALDEALASCFEAEQKLDGAFAFAFDDKLGYLTACPTNLGTGMRASVMLHLPALTESRQMRHIVNAVTKLGIAVRGFYGEGSDAAGGYYQISNQTTMGVTEEDIADRLMDTVNNIMVRETAVRRDMRAANPAAWDDHVTRAYGLLTNARLLPFDEALHQLSLVRMGVLEGVISGVTTGRIDRLTAGLGPATLMFESGGDLPPQTRDERRADKVRAGLTAHEKE